MEPSSESTKLEGDGKTYEYLAAGKLKGCKSLITGGECVPHPFRTKPLVLIRHAVPESVAPWPYSLRAKAPT